MSLYELARGQWSAAWTSSTSIPFSSASKLPREVSNDDLRAWLYDDQYAAAMRTLGEERGGRHRRRALRITRNIQGKPGAFNGEYQRFG